MSEVLKMAIALISVLNPLGAIPTFLTLTSRNSDQEIRKISNTCSLAVFITLIVALFLGSHILDFFGITIASFRIGSGILFGGMAMNMMSAKPAQTKLSQDEVDSQLNVKEIGIVPLAIPMLSGPGAMSTIIVHAEHFKKPTHWVGAVLILLVISLMVKYMLRFARKIGARIGKIGVNVMTRVMGLILMAIAIETITRGLKQIFPSLL